MREITIGGQPVIIAASPITLYIYSREFGPKADLMADLLSMGAFEQGRLDQVQFLSLLKVTWAMAKTAKLGGEFPHFEGWLLGIGEVDFSDQALWEGVVAEVSRGFFRGAAPQPPVIQR